MFKDVSRNTWLLHLTVLIWGFTGILGALIETSALNLVWYRVFIAAFSLAIYFKIKGKSLIITKKQFFQYTITGGMVGLHWVLFFASIKASTVSVALVCLSSLTLFTAFLEPLINRRKIAWVDILAGLVIVLGIYLIFTFESNYTQGIIFGISAALLASIFAIINSKLIKTGSAPIISFYEMAGAFFWISLYMLFTNKLNNALILPQSDILYLIILGTVCTAAAYVFAVEIMKELSAFTVALATNLEPIYGITLAWILLGSSEKMSPGFYAGAVIVLATVFLYPYLKSRLITRKYRKNKTGKKQNKPD